jgi:hypothetical protein
VNSTVGRPFASHCSAPPSKPHISGELFRLML